MEEEREYLSRSTSLSTLSVLYPRLFLSLQFCIVWLSVFLLPFHNLSATATYQSLNDSIPVSTSVDLFASALIALTF